MKVLVTGGSGFLGSWIARALAERGDDVRVLHRPSSDLASLAGVRYESAPGDVTEPESLASAMKGVEAIFHCAGIVAHSPADEPIMERVNVEGTRLVVEAALAAGVRRLVHTSTVVAVGASKRPTLIDESWTFDPKVIRTPYARTKRRAEEIVLDAVAKRKLDAVCVNPSVVFGAGDAVKGSRKSHLRYAAGKMLFYPSGGANVVHVADVVNAHLAALDRGRTGERYIVGGENLLLADLFRTLAEAGGKPPAKIRVPGLALRAFASLVDLLAALGLPIKMATHSFRSATLFHWYDASKAIRELGITFRPVRPAIEESVQWARARGLC